MVQVIKGKFTCIIIEIIWRETKITSSKWEDRDEVTEGKITVKRQFNEVPRDWGNLFVKLRARYIEQLHLTNFRENYQNICYIEV